MRDRVGIVLHKIVPSEKGKAKFELKFISFCHRLQWTDHRVLGCGKLRSFCMNIKFNVINHIKTCILHCIVMRRFTLLI